MSGTIFTSWKDSFGISHIDEPVALYENGKIYAAADGFLGTVTKGTLIGEYESGIVYTIGTGGLDYGKRINAIAVYDEYGRIYSVSYGALGGITKSLSVGECSSGKVYSLTHKITEGAESIGLYNGDTEGAAAASAIALFRLESDVSAYNDDLNNYSKSSYSSSSSSSSSSGDGIEGFFETMGCLFKTIGIIFSGVALIGVWLAKLIKKGIGKYKETKAKKAVEIKKTVKTEAVTPTENTKKPTGNATRSYEAPKEEKSSSYNVFAEDPVASDIFPDSSTTVNTEEPPKNASSSRLISTMSKSSASESEEKSEGFRMAGDL